MTQLADAHIHLFEHSLQGSFSDRPGVQIDEAACYDSLAKDHDVVAALVVCYAGSVRHERNNEYVAGLMTQYDWIHPTAYVDPGTPPTLDMLEQWRDRGFVGLTLYVDSAKIELLRRFPDNIWDWMIERHWLVSVNSSGDNWAVWQDVLGRHNELRLVMSHLGLPPKVKEPIEQAQAETAMVPQVALSRFPEVRVKLSGFYALTDPSYDYPHERAWPYVQVLIDSFGIERLVWASDYAPCLEHQTFPQTLGLFWKMPFLTDADRDRIIGANLLQLLKDARISRT